MPWIKLETTVALSDEQRNELLGALSRLVAECIGKPEQYVMVGISTDAMVMSGQSGAAAFVEVRSIGGLNSRVNQTIAQKTCQLLERSLGIPPARVYLNFSDVPATNWGWRGDTFG